PQNRFNCGKYFLSSCAGGCQGARAGVAGMAGGSFTVVGNDGTAAGPCGTCGPGCGGAATAVSRERSFSCAECPAERNGFPSVATRARNRALDTPSPAFRSPVRFVGCPSVPTCR